MYYSGILGIILTLLQDATFSWVRMFIALGASIIISIAVGIYAATNNTAEKVILPVVDILQTLPILAFFPFVIFVVVATVPGVVGINIAVIFLIITSMIWNIIFGVYEAVKVLPKEYFELSELYGLTPWEKLRKILIPAVMPRVIEQSILSWSIGLFYLVTSEIFSTGSSMYVVKYGIGAAIATAGNLLTYALAIIIFVIFVIGTRFLFFKPLEDHFTKYNRYFGQNMKAEIRRTVPYAREMEAIGHRLMKTFARRTLMEIGTSFAKGTRNVGRRISGSRANISFERSGKVIGYAILAILVAGIAYIIATHTFLLGYEYQVLQALSLSFARVWLAFVVSLAIGIPVCVYLIFITRHSSKYVLLFQIIASIPATILLPAIASTLHNYPHSGETVAFVVFVLSSIWYIIFSTMNMARTLPQNIFEVKKVFGVKGSDAWRKIYIKAIIPGLITGGITAIAAEWNASIVAEYFAFGGNLSQVGTGIGKLLDLSLAGNNLALMLVALVNLTVMIILINTFVWKRLYKGVVKTYR